MGKRFKMLLSPSPNLQLVHYRIFYFAPLPSGCLSLHRPPDKRRGFLGRHQHDSHNWCHPQHLSSLSHHDQREKNDDQHLHDVAAGEVPNLFPADEKAEILERVQNTAREEGR